MRDFKMKTILITFSLVALTSNATFAESSSKNDLFLECEYRSTLHMLKMENSATSGTKLIQVTPLKNGMATIKEEGLGAILKGTISENEIYGEVNYQIQNNIYFQSFRINRYTGVFENIFSIATNKSDGLLHSGVCKEASKRF